MISNAGIAESKGTVLTTTGTVGIADNGTQIIVMNGTYGYSYTLATGVFDRISDADFPGADTVIFLDGYFVINKPSSGRFYVSALYAGTNWDALAYATAESTRHPGQGPREISLRFFLNIPNTAHLLK